MKVQKPKQSDYVQILRGSKKEAVAGRCGTCSGRCTSVDLRKKS